MATGLWLPRRYVKPTAIVFWYSEKLNHIRVGAPEQFPIPPILQAQGYEKMVCRNANDVAIWSQKLRDQERREKEIEDAKREAIEGPIRDAIRADLIYRRDHAPNVASRAAAQYALDKADALERERAEKESRTSYQHCEGFEEGH